MRRPAIVGNWKLWGTRAQAADYCDRLLQLLPDERRRPADVGIAAPFTALDLCVEKLRGSGVGVYARTPEELREGMEAALRSRRPTLINAVIDETAGTESGRITSLNPTAKKK